MVTAFRQGLQEFGYAEGRNVVIEYRFAEHQHERLPALAADLVNRQVTLIAATTTHAAVVAKAATTTIPIVFEMGGDPVRLGLVTSLNRSGGNVTGVIQLNVVVAPKRLELLHQLVPSATVVSLLIDPTDPNTERITSDMQALARSLAIELHVLNARTEHDLDAVFAKLIQLRAGGLVIGPSALFIRSVRLAALTLRHAIPTVGGSRETGFVAAGGLAGYGGSLADSYRLAGIYAARILKGEKPSEMPVQQATKVELLLNLKTAKALGVTLPPTLLARADEVIE